MISSYFIDFWNTFHWEYIYLNLNSIFDKDLWLYLNINLYGIDIGYWLEEALKSFHMKYQRNRLNICPYIIF